MDSDCTHHDAVVGGKSSFHLSKDVLSFFNLKKRVQKKINIYTHKHKSIPVKIANSWFNIHHEGGSLTNHDHPNSVLSVALYINVDEYGSSLTFYNPNSLMSFLWHTKTEENFNHRKYKMSPKNGDMYIFPSWLQHGSKSFAGTKNRIVISANTDWNVKINNFSYEYNS